MKKGFNVVLIMFLTIISLCLCCNVSAGTTVSSFPQTIGNISEGGSAQYNGYDFFHFKKGSNYAVFCTKFKLDTPAGHSCSLTSDWSNPVKAGVAAIINKANVSDSGISQNYYYAELAINEFLYYYGGYNANNKISSSRSVKTVLGSHYNYYEEAVKAYNKVKGGVDAGIDLTSGKSTWTINQEINDNKPTNVYKITTENTTSTAVTVSATTNIPSGVTVKIYTSNDNSNYTDTGKTLTSSTKSQNITKANYVKVEVNGLTKLEEEKTMKIKVNVQGTLSYNIAAQYNCGSGYQTITPNIIQASSKSDSANSTFTVKTTDTVDYPKLKIVKTDKDNKQTKLSKAYYKITLNDENVTTKYTNDNGEITYDELEDGTYCVQETKAPNGYFLDNTKHCFTITKESTTTANKIKFTSSDNAISYDDDGVNEKEGLITISLEDTKNKVSLGKIDVNGNFVEGATLKLTNTNDRDAEAYSLNNQKLEWVSGKSAKEIEGLPAGTYYLFEMKAPDGFVLNANPAVVRVSATTKKMVTVNLEDERNSLSISKVDITTKQELPGATLRVLDENGKVVVLNGEKLEWVSTDKPRTFYGIKAGTYYLEETIAPDGYKKLPEKIKFSIDEYGLLTIDDETAHDSVLIMTNEYNKVYISKQDITTKKELPGAHLKLLDADGNVVEEWDSTSEPHLIEGLRAGTYTLIETTAPEGYTLNSEKITFSIDEYGNITGDTVMYNTPIPEVPNTFSSQSLIVTIGGLLLVSVGVGLYIYGLKKQKSI